MTTVNKEHTKPVQVVVQLHLNASIEKAQMCHGCSVKTAHRRTDCIFVNVFFHPDNRNGLKITRMLDHCISTLKYSKNDYS